MFGYHPTESTLEVYAIYLFALFASPASGTQTCVRAQYLKDKTECRKN